MNLLKKTKVKNTIIFIALMVGIFLALGFSIGFGSVKIKLFEVFNILFRGEGKNSTFYDIVWTIRFPRVLAALVSGCALATSGLLLQILFKNPIVEPYVLGVSSGATLFVGLIMLGGLQFGIENVSPIMSFVAAFIGSLIVMILVVLFATKVKNVVTLLVIGLMVGYICSAITSGLTAFADKERLQGFTLWRMGSFSGFTWSSVKVLIVVSTITIICSLFIVKPLNAFLLGEEYAKSMGVRIKLFRIIIVIISSILAAVVTAFAGPVSFIGLAIPHIARLIFKTSDNKILLPGTILLGGIITSICDVVARIAFAPTELPISAVTSIIGAPIVIFLILNRRTTL